MIFSPGVSFILSKVLPQLALPPIIGYGVYIGAHAFIEQNIFTLPSRSCIILYVTGILVGWKRLKEIWVRKIGENEANRLHAIPVPELQGRLPWNVDILYTILRSSENEYIGEPFTKWSEQHGHTMNFKVLGGNTIWTDEPHNIKIVLATGFTNYVKGPTFQLTMESVLGTGVFNSDGQMWKFHRSIARPFFSHDRISDFDIFAKHCDNTILKMNKSFKSGQPIDFQDIAARFTLDSATEFLFGQCVNSLELPLAALGSQPLSSILQFPQAFQSAQEMLVNRLRREPIWPLWEIGGDATKDQMKVINEYITPILEAALEKQTSEVADMDLGSEKGVAIAQAKRPETFLDHLVSVTDDISTIRDQILNILIAGRDTTAATLTFAVYLLAQHPHVLIQLRQEIMTAVGPVDRPTFEHIKGMKYLRAVINETLRLFPPVPFNMRTCMKSTVWTSPETGTGHYIPANTSIVYSVFHMHRRTDLWGEDALEFSPMRWIDDRKRYQLANPFIFLPFNAGPRICLGQQFAYNEASFFLIRLLQTFSYIELAPEYQQKPNYPPSKWQGAPGRKEIERVVPRAALTVYSLGGLWVRMSDKTDASD